MRLVGLLILVVGSMVLMVNKSEPEMIWNKDRPLKWQDFKGKPDQTVRATALTASGIVFQYSVNSSNDRIVGFKSDVKAYFYPNKSWVKPKEATQNILNHEQLHFDITELHARIFRKKLQEVQVSQHLAEDLDKLHLQINKEWAQMQETYDDETNFSREVSKQLEWQQKVADQLNKLQDYK